MDSSDWSNRIRHHIFDTRPNNFSTPPAEVRIMSMVLRWPVVWRKFSLPKNAIPPLGAVTLVIRLSV
jgi:hypothetical protein